MTECARIDLLGAPLDPRTAAESAADLFKLVDGGGRCTHVVTLNPEYVMTARRDAPFLAAIRRADLVLADGVGVVVAARVLGGGEVERLTGVEIVERLAKRGTRLFLLGAGPGVAHAASAKLRARFPQTSIAGTWADGSARPADDTESMRRIGESRATVVAVAYGAQGQVLWIDRNRDALTNAGVTVAIGIGGALDYLAEISARPPAFVRKFGMEWLWRLGQEPWRWRRQLVLPQFVVLVLIERVRRAGRR